MVEPCWGTTKNGAESGTASDQWLGEGLWQLRSIKDAAIVNKSVLAENKFCTEYKIICLLGNGYYHSLSRIGTICSVHRLHPKVKTFS